MTSDRHSQRHALAMLLAATIALGLGLYGRQPARAADAKPLKVCLVSGSLEYKSAETLPEFQRFLEANYGVQCTRAFLIGKDLEHLPGLENLDDCDVMLLFTKRLKLSGEELERIRTYCLSGKPIVGVRTASHAIQTWLDLDKEVLGGNYKGHYGNDVATDVKLVDAAKGHPILAGVEPFRSVGSLYKNQGLAEDTHVLLTGTSPEATEPIAWTRNYKGGRIFYTSLGHPQDFQEPSFQRMLVNALFWAAQREPQPKQTADAGFELQKDIVYGTGGGEPLKLDLATPRGLTSPVPAIVWIHGGAWQGGSKHEFEGYAVEAAKRGYVSVTISYRLAPRHLFPAQVEDCKCAVRWLRANAEKLHVDPQRIGVGGSSAGGHLALMLGAMDSSDGFEGEGGAADASSRVQAVISYAGPTNLRSEYPDASKGVLVTLLGGPISDKQDAARQASPVNYVSPGDPPMLLVHGTKDPLVPYDQAIQMAEALTKAGVPGRLELLIGQGHGWPEESERVTRITFAFFEQQLKK